MDMTGWVQGQIFVQTVDEKEVEAVSAFLNARSLSFQVLTLSERMVVDGVDPDDAVSTDRFSIAIQLAGFPRSWPPLLTELTQRVHGGGWDDEVPPPSDDIRCQWQFGPQRLDKRTNFSGFCPFCRRFSASNAGRHPITPK